MIPSMTAAFNLVIGESDKQRKLTLSCTIRIITEETTHFGLVNKNKVSQIGTFIYIPRIYCKYYVFKETKILSM